MDIELRKVAIDKLVMDPQNVRRHDEANIEAIKRSLNKFGQRKPIICVQGHNNKIVVIAGNGTLQAAKLLGWTHLQVSMCPPDWDADKARAYAIADNRTAELANWDDVALANALVDLDAVGWDLFDIGFKPIQPSTDPYQEWTDMPDYQQEQKLSAFSTTVHFGSEADAIAFFELLGTTKKSSFWWPESDGLKGSDVKLAYVQEDE